tara:strand:+ start:428 stop:628 length:201 start_codon:yes stop_codon:yes gene_type:complete
MTYSVYKRIAKEYAELRGKKIPFRYKGLKYTLKDLIGMLRRTKQSVIKINGKYELNKSRFPELKNL